MNNPAQNHAATAALADVLRIEPARAAAISAIFQPGDVPLIAALAGHPLAADVFGRLIELRRIQRTAAAMINAAEAVAIDLEQARTEAGEWGRRVELAGQLSAQRIDTTTKIADKPNPSRIVGIFKPGQQAAEIAGEGFGSFDPQAAEPETEPVEIPVPGGETTENIEAPPAPVTATDGPRGGMMPRAKTCTDCEAENCDCSP